MSFFEKIIVAHSEKYLSKYRESALHIRNDLRLEYESYLPELHRCYSEAGFWHGTGRFHYIHQNDSRYEGMKKGHVLNIFESILTHGGLNNHQDLWYNEEQFQKTVSVAPTRMHARMYAHIHLREGTWLEYVFGGTKFWMGIIAVLAIKEICSPLTKRNRSLVKNALLNKKALDSFRIWASAIRNCSEFKVLPIWRAYDLRSDIPGNHAVLFGIKHSAIQEGTNPFIKNFEVRVTRPISLNEMTHIEVPMENIADTKKLLEEKGIRLPVIPLEFGELFSSQLPLSKLLLSV